MKCRHCAQKLELPLVDLGCAPPSNAYLPADRLQAPETHFPLVVMVCEHCWLVQTLDFTRADELFSEDYAYFSSFSSSWLTHAQRYADAMIERFGLGRDSMVVEVASNDGYLLQYFKARDIPCLGVEPTASTAGAARERGIETIERFFGVDLGRELAASGRSADLMAANNVLAHVPDINDFLGGFAAALDEDGVATFEFPHLLNLIEQMQFDTIYHEHFSYLSLLALDTIFPANGLAIWDVEELPTHGGSLRVYAQRLDRGTRPRAAAVDAMLEREHARGLDRASGYAGFQAKAERLKDDLVAFLIDAKREGKTVAAYGAAAKGNTMLNFAGVRPDLVAYVVDRNPAKQGQFMPGSRIPIVGEERIAETRPDYVLILPWNLEAEVRAQLSSIEEWGGRFVVAVPSLRVT